MSTGIQDSDTGVGGREGVDRKRDTEERWVGWVLLESLVVAARAHISTTIVTFALFVRLSPIFGDLSSFSNQPLTTVSPFCSVILIFCC